MNVHVSYRLHKTRAVEKDFQHQIERLRKRLQVFRPELIHLKGAVEENAGREEITVSLNLRLPSGQLAVQQAAASATTAVKTAFDDLLQQVNKHKELLRSSHKWQRRSKEMKSRRVPEVPFEQTLAAVVLPTISTEDVRGYVNVNLSRLERFVEREIYFREVQELLPDDTVTKYEVIDETIAAALDENQEKPERLALEPWLYRLALKALDKLSRRDDSNGSAVHLEDSMRQQNVRASDEAELQFHQPDESITEESVIADNRVSTPEQICASDEMVRLIAVALRDVSAGQREAFILYALEGFGIEEIADISGLPVEDVVASIAVARDHLRRAPALSRQFPGRFIPSGAA
jgi:DNA-directed RNA polymerase specialized sigma24 family protein/ribosome-associated translation inhibitor RaiA